MGDIVNDRQWECQKIRGEIVNGGVNISAIVNNSIKSIGDIINIDGSVKKLGGIVNGSVSIGAIVNVSVSIGDIVNGIINGIVKKLV